VFRLCQPAVVSGIQRFKVGAVVLTRVEYFDVALDPSLVQLTVEQVRAVPWACPTWAENDGNVKLGQAVWVVQSQGRTIVVHPCGASDQFLRTLPDAIKHQEAVMAKMRAAGLEPDHVDVVVLSHLDGIGMTAVVDRSGAWAPAFAKARVVLSEIEAEFIETCTFEIGGAAAFAALRAQGVVDPVVLPYAITDEVELVASPGHTPGHGALVVRSNGERAVFIGHLALNPVNVTAKPSRGHLDPWQAWQTLNAILDEASRDGALVIGPLWPAPGAAVVSGKDASRKLTPAQ